MKEKQKYKVLVSNLLVEIDNSRRGLDPSKRISEGNPNGRGRISLDGIDSGQVGKPKDDGRISSNGFNGRSLDSGVDMFTFGLFTRIQEAKLYFWKVIQDSCMALLLFPIKALFIGFLTEVSVEGKEFLCL